MAARRPTPRLGRAVRRHRDRPARAAPGSGAVPWPRSGARRRRTTRAPCAARAAPRGPARARRTVPGSRCPGRTDREPVGRLTEPDRKSRRDVRARDPQRLFDKGGRAECVRRVQPVLGRFPVQLAQRPDLLRRQGLPADRVELAEGVVAQLVAQRSAPRSVRSILSVGIPRIAVRLATSSTAECWKLASSMLPRSSA